MFFDTMHQAIITHTGNDISRYFAYYPYHLKITVYVYVITNWGNVEILGNIVPLGVFVLYLPQYC